MNYKAICCDADGTLLTSDKRISEENIKWIQRVVNEKKVKFVIVSGRMLTGVRKFYSEIGINGPASCCNGTCLFDEKDNLIQDFRIEKQHIRTIINCAHEHKLDLVYICGNDWYMENRDNWTYQTKLKFYFKDCIIADLNNLMTKAQPNKMVVMSQNKTELESFKNDLFKRNLTDKEIFYYEGKDFIEMMPAYADKAMSLDVISEYFSIPMEQIVAIGDDFNDIKMLKKAGLGVAMKNALPEVKAIADYVTSKTNNEDGVASMIQEIFFS